MGVIGVVHLHVLGLHPLVTVHVLVHVLMNRLLLWWWLGRLLLVQKGIKTYQIASLLSSCAHCLSVLRELLFDNRMHLPWLNWDLNWCTGVSWSGFEVKIDETDICFLGNDRHWVFYYRLYVFDCLFDWCYLALLLLLIGLF